MIVRTGMGYLRVVRQPDHGRHTGLLAACWGGPGFTVPSDALVDAASHHDDGWIGWEPRPGPEGRPVSFTELGVEEHLVLWRRGIALAEEADPYRALLVSRHAVGLYRRFFFKEERDEWEEGRVWLFCREQEKRQARWVAALERDPGRRALVKPDALHDASRLLSLWDLLSLLLCGGAESAVLEGCPGPSGPRDVRVEIGRDEVRLDPFPFREPVELSFLARRIPPGPYPDPESLREALAAAPAQSVSHRLRPGRRSGGATNSD